jgi:thiol-disulfide isomerase/thioredoxin
VRYLIALTLVAVLVGCTSSRPRPLAAAGDTSSTKPFVGSPSSPDKEAAGTSTSTSQESGYLAGSVYLDRRPVTNAVIRISPAEPGDKAARLTVKSTNAGYFTAPGVEKGQRYKLVATARRGDQSWTGQTVTWANDTRIVIYLHPAPSPTATTSGTSGTVGATETDGIGHRDEGGVTMPAGSGSPPAPMPPPVITDPKQVAGGQPRRDFDSAPPPVPATIPGPSRKPMVPAPPMRDVDGVTIPKPGATPAVPRPAPPSEKKPPSTGPLLVPSCVRPGNLENFALYDFKGNRWELAEKQTGKLVLLHFWTLSCPHCPPSIPKLVELQGEWGGKGLQVVSILHDEGNLARRRQAVLNIAARYDTRYNFPVLFSERDCPVRKSMRIFSSPTLVLLDDSGREIGRWEGLDEITRRDILWHLKKRLAK